MNILAFDSSAIAASACIMHDREIISESFLQAGLTHSQTLLPAIEGVLTSVKMSMSDIDYVAITVGPGSFTGVKISVSTAKGLAFPRNLPCISISSLEALAYNLSAVDGIICPVMDARRQQLYTAVFENNSNIITRKTKDSQLLFDELIDELKIYDKVHLTGDGAKIFYGYCTEKNVNNVILPPENLFLCRAGNVAQAALKHMDSAQDSHLIQPLYLRPPQAERERLEKLNQSNQSK